MQNVEVSFPQEKRGINPQGCGKICGKCEKLGFGGQFSTESGAFYGFGCGKLMWKSGKLKKRKKMKISDLHKIYKKTQKVDLAR